MTPIYISITDANGTGLNIDAEWVHGGKRKTASTKTSIDDVELLETLVEQVATGRLSISPDWDTCSGQSSSPEMSGL